MSCTEPTEAMLDLLETLRDWPDIDTGELRERPEWDQAFSWGWVMSSGEFCGC
jgi:hypothetical protein